jgi:hypothetical protein
MYVGDDIDSSNTFFMLEGDPVVYPSATHYLNSTTSRPSLTSKLLSLIIIDNVDGMS